MLDATIILGFGKLCKKLIEIAQNVLESSTEVLSEPQRHAQWTAALATMHEEHIRLMEAMQSQTASTMQTMQQENYWLHQDIQAMLQIIAQLSLMTFAESQQQIRTILPFVQSIQQHLEAPIAEKTNLPALPAASDQHPLLPSSSSANEAALLHSTASEIHLILLRSGRYHFDAETCIEGNRAFIAFAHCQTRHVFVMAIVSPSLQISCLRYPLVSFLYEEGWDSQQWQMPLRDATGHFQQNPHFFKSSSAPDHASLLEWIEREGTFTDNWLEV